jgi:hypothetical protein
MPQKIFWMPKHQAEKAKSVNLKKHSRKEMKSGAAVTGGPWICVLRNRGLMFFLCQPFFYHLLRGLHLWCSGVAAYIVNGW